MSHSWAAWVAQGWWRQAGQVEHWQRERGQAAGQDLGQESRRISVAGLAAMQRSVLPLCLCTWWAV